MKRHTQQGMALVITLIMLAVITIVSVAFLAVSRRDRASAQNAFNMSDALLMADAARQRGFADIAAILMSPTNVGLMVSTNWDIDTNNWTALLNDPRPPVFVMTNRPPNANPALDFRFFLDLNRNGAFEPTAYMDALGNVLPLGDTNGIWYIGDPQWIGVSEQPVVPSRYNRFIGRYCYLIVPAGRALDINFIHNQALPKGNSFRFYRNQGFGTYEINLAAFLADLNTNLWGMGPNLWTGMQNPYILTFSPGGLPISNGDAFRDALDLLRFRFRGGEYPASSLVANVFGGKATAFTSDGIDGCAFPPAREDLPDQPWPGGNNLRNYFSMHDFLNAANRTNFSSFYDNLMRVSGATNEPYHRYTFYRMLEQMTTDSAPERSDLGPEHEQKINLNYSNALANFTATNPLHSTIQPGAETNFVDWDPTQFFMTVSERLLRREMGRFTWDEGLLIYTNCGNNGTPYWTNMVTGQEQMFYSGRIHQLLKITANLYDATHTNYFPTVFRPQFATRSWNVPGVSNIYIVGYTNETSTGFFQQPWHTLDALGGTNVVGFNDNIYDIPVIVGAKKGHPAFNKLASDTIVSVSRKIMFCKNSPQDAHPKQVGGTNQMFIIGITNSFGVSAWNSYSNSYPMPGRTIALWVSNHINGVVHFDNKPYATDTNCMHAVSLTSGQWQGYQKNLSANEASFCVPMYTNIALRPNSIFDPSGNPPFQFTGSGNTFSTNFSSTGQMDVYISNRFNFYIVDITPGGPSRLIDAVSFSDLNTKMDLGLELSNAVKNASTRFVRGLWDFTPLGAINQGVNNQILISTHDQDSFSTIQDWGDYAQGPVYLRTNATSLWNWLTTASTDPYDTVTNRQAGFSPWQRIRHRMMWEVNDPMVHFVTNDLVMWTNATIALKAGEYVDSYSGFTNFQLFKINEAYKPWRYSESDNLATDLTIRDPQVMCSDDWNYPNGKLASIGLIGRVHRGTPWQTIYLKDRAADSNIWMYPKGPGYSLDTHPTNDWWLVDFFTVAQHPNATRGQLSINQPDIAAWSAVLSGVGVTALGQDASGSIHPVDYNIEPAAKDPGLQKIWDGINRKRASMTNGLFSRFSELLSVPELTTGSPYLSFTNFMQDEKKNYLRDDDYERIPQQVLSLLRLGDERYVIYAWGQSLKPAPNSIVTSGNNFGVCTNYQITGEVATRTVVRFERPMVPRHLLNPATGEDLGPVTLDYYEPLVRDTNSFRAVVESYNLMPPE